MYIYMYGGSSCTDHPSESMTSEKSYFCLLGNTCFIVFSTLDGSYVIDYLFCEIVSFNSHNLFNGSPGE